MFKNLWVVESKLLTMEMSISKNIPWCIAQCLFWAKALSSDTTCTTHHIASTSSREIQRIPSRPCAVARMNADQDIHSLMFTLLLNTCSHNGLRGCAKWPQDSRSHYITGEHTDWLIQNYLKTVSVCEKCSRLLYCGH